MEQEQRKQRYLEMAQAISERIGAGDMEGVERLVDELTHIRETELFRELGRLTRELHESLKTFRLDSRLAELTEHEIPDARERLNYVITMTEQAAHRTLAVIEDTMELTSSLVSRSGELRSAWSRFRSRQMSVDEFRQLSHQLDEFFAQVEQQGSQVQDKLTEALMAQGYQDLTGQIIRKVIRLVQDVEESLIELVRISGSRKTAENSEAADNSKEPAQKDEVTAGSGPRIPGRSNDDEYVHDQDDVDALLSSLGF
ncbi:MAG: protein phosphatase CheZ [Xanthomonadaceae bacterium]|nr:protein phosphatase CheZ [Xanthomonadaceae bacterium]